MLFLTRCKLTQMEKYKLVISIPVHEKPDVINNQINNFNKYINDFAIVLHISKSFFETYTIDEIQKYKNVYINPVNLDTKWADIIQTHLSNYDYIKNVLNFDYFVLHASNDMYIKKGFDKYIQKFEAGFNIRKVIEPNSYWWPGNLALQDTDLVKIMKKCGQSMVIASQVESSFYKRDIMEQISRIISSTLQEKQCNLIYPREEIYFSTVASALVSWQHVGEITTFSEVHRFDRTLWKWKKRIRSFYYTFKINAVVPENVFFVFERIFNDNLFKTNFYRTTPQIIKKLLANNKKYTQRNSFLNDGSGTFQLYGENIFSVKRVKRDINDSLRQYITNLKR